MLDQLLSLDTQLLIYLNSLGSEPFDGFWLFITKQSHWTPFFLVLIFLIYRKNGLKSTVYTLVFVGMLLAFTDQITNLFKFGFERLRPCSNPKINTIIRVVESSATFSFFSGHAANTTAVAVFLYHILKKHYKQAYLLFLWPLIFAYSRIYLGLHYPLDIFCGHLFGFLSGSLFVKLYQFYLNSQFKRQ